MIWSACRLFSVIFRFLFDPSSVSTNSIRFSTEFQHFPGNVDEKNHLQNERGLFSVLYLSRIAETFREVRSTVAALKIQNISTSSSLESRTRLYVIVVFAVPSIILLSRRDAALEYIRHLKIFVQYSLEWLRKSRDFFQSELKKLRFQHLENSLRTAQKHKR